MAELIQPISGATVLTPLTGNEYVPILAGTVHNIATVSQVAAVGGAGPQVIAAAGATQGNATAITNTSGAKALKVIVNVATTVSTHGVKLPAVSTGLTVLVASAGSFGVKVYPSTGQKIAAASTNAADTTIAINKANTYIGVSTTKWVVQRGS